MLVRLALKSKSLNKKHFSIYIWGQNRTTDIERFRALAKQNLKSIETQLTEIDTKTVLPACKPNFLRYLIDQKANSQPEDNEKTSFDLENILLKNFTLFSHRGYLSWFPCMTSYPGMLGQMLTYGFTGTQTDYNISIAPIQLEKVVTNWFKKAYNLPSNFSKTESGAVIYHGVSLSSIGSTLASKKRMLKLLPGSDEKKFKYYCSEMAHYSLRKAANIAGSKSEIIPVIFSEKKNNFIMNTKALEVKIKEDILNGFIPTYINSTIGTTGSTAVDDIFEIGELAKKYNMWYHIDAAYAGNSLILPEYNWVLYGLELANSFAFNPVKLFPILQNSACCYFSDLNEAILAYEVEKIPDLNKASQISYEFTTTRHNKALKMFTLLNSYGTSSLKDLATRIFRAARLIEEILSKDNRFEVMFAPSNFGLVCFKLSNRGNKDLIKFMNKVNEGGKLFLGPYDVKLSDNSEIILLRISVNWLYTTEEVIRENIKDITDSYDKAFEV